MNSNPLELLDQNIKLMNRLAVLGISYTLIKEIPETIVKLDNMQALNCYGTPLTEPAKIIAQRGIMSIKKYFLAKQEVQQVQTPQPGGGGNDGESRKSVD